MKKFISYPVFLVLFLSIIGILLYGSLLRYHYVGGEHFKYLREVAVFVARLPKQAIYVIREGTFNLNKPKVLTKHMDKKARFNIFIENERNALLILPRYDHSLSRSIVEIIDLKNFNVIHKFSHDFKETLKKVKNVKEFPNLQIDQAPIRMQYRHALLLDDGSLVADSGRSMEFKIDFCSNLLWVNDEEVFHHSKELDHEGNIWVGGTMRPQSKYVKKFSIEKFLDDSIIKINTDGKILFNKSVLEILIQNDILPNNFALTSAQSGEMDPIHLNDIQPVFNDTLYWKQGDLFISIRNKSSIIHYRPSMNKVINYITGPFSQQHDVDIISNKEILIFDNNNFFVNSEFSEIEVYNFETKTFRKLFNDQMQKENFKTNTQGLSHVFKDGALMVEEQNHGRIILFNNRGEKEWEFINKDKNGDIGFVSWSRVVEDETFIKKFKSLVKNKKCLN